MIPPKKPLNEEERLKALYSYSILDTLTEPDYDNIVTIASLVCDTPISSITLIDRDRQWFKSRKGLKNQETPRIEAFCAHAVAESSEIFMVENAAEDPRFHDYPNVLGDPKIAFYAGVPLIDEDGYALGTLCVIDNQPRKLDARQTQALKALSKQVMNLLELRRKRLQLEEALLQLHEKNKQLEEFALIAAHDIRSPITAIAGLTDFLTEGFNAEMNPEMREIVGILNKSSNKVVNLVDGILAYSRNRTANMPKQELKVKDLFEDLRGLFPTLNHEGLVLKTEVKTILVNTISLKQVLLNLITNGIKYNDKPGIKIELKLSEDSSKYTFVVKDNGMGIDNEHFDDIFHPFKKVHKEDRFGQTGNGIGLSTAKALVEEMGGKIAVESTVGEGSTFTFTVSKD